MGRGKPACLRQTLWAIQFQLEQPPPHTEGFGTVWPKSGGQWQTAVQALCIPASLLPLSLPAPGRHQILPLPTSSLTCGDHPTSPLFRPSETPACPLFCRLLCLEVLPDAPSHPSVCPQLLVACGLPCTLTQASLLPSAYACLDADEGGNISFTYSAFLSRVCLPRWTLAPWGRAVCVSAVSYLLRGRCCSRRLCSGNGWI